jgi:hypothetical protein
MGAWEEARAHDKAVKGRMRWREFGRNLRIELRLMETKTDGVLEAQEEARVAASTREVEWGHTTAAKRGGVAGSFEWLPPRLSDLAACRWRAWYRRVTDRDVSAPPRCVLSFQHAERGQPSILSLT